MTLSFNVSQKSPGEYFISAEELLAGYRSKTPEQSYELEKKQNADLASITQGWFTHNPMTLKNMNSWGRLMICYLNAIEDDITAENVEPLKSYLSVIGSLREEQLIPKVDTLCPRFEAFRDVMKVLMPALAVDVHQSLCELAKDKSFCFDTVAQRMEASRRRQIRYDELVHDSEGDYKDTPAGLFMRALVGLSYNEVWDMPNKPLYDNAWDSLDEGDLECCCASKYEPELDIVAHLAKVLPNSMDAALNYYEDNESIMLYEQQQHILGMSLSSLSMPSGIENLMNVLYYRDNSEALQIFTAINPAAQMFSECVSLYDCAKDAVTYLSESPQTKAILAFADSCRDKNNADELIASFKY